MPIKLQVFAYTFSPKLVTSLITLVLVPFLVSLGLWQLNKADEKRLIDLGVRQAIAQPALSFNDEMVDLSQLESAIYRSAKISGHYDTKQFLLDNRTHKGLPGYHVISPFLFKQNKTSYAILVNRGWITYKGTRDNITDITLDKNVKEITGALKKIPESIVLNNQISEVNDFSNPFFKTDNEQLENVVLIQSIQLDNMNKMLNYDLLPIVLELDDTVEDGYVREWQPYFGSIDKHNAYALQWFAMAAILVFLYFKLNIKKD